MTFKVKDGLQVGNNIFVNATLDVNANTITVSNTLSIGGATVNSSFFTGTANTSLYAYNGKSESSLNANSALYANQANYAGIANVALYAYSGKSEESLNANSATYSTNAEFAYTANVANFLNGKAEQAINANSALYANYATYAGIANVALYAYSGKSEESLNANSATYAVNAEFAYTANIANFLNGKAESALDANTALYANYATYAGIANVALYAYSGKSEESLNANSATYATNAQFAYTANVANFLNGVAADALNTNSALYANYATYAGIANAALYSYGGKAEEALNANSATYSTNAEFAYTANSANFLNGVAADALAANSATYATNAQFAYTANVANYLNGKAESALDANTALYANVANYLNGKAESALDANTALYANVANFLNGKAESALDANTAQYLGGFNSAYYTNATNISTGTLAEPRLPFRMNQNVRTSDDVIFANGTFIGTVSIGGDLVLTGNLYSQNVQSLSVSDPLIKLGSNNAADTLWGGFTIHYSGSGNTTNHAGLVRDPSTKEFILMSTYGDEVSIANNNTIVVTDPSFSYANLAVNSIKLGNNTSYSTLDANTYSGTSNNAAYVYGKQESQLSVANAIFATTAGNVSGDNVSGTVSNSNNAIYLQSRTWETAGAIGLTVANTGAFTTLNATGNVTISGGNALQLTNGTSNWISWNTNGTGVPTVSTRSVGTKLVLYPTLSENETDYAIGINAATLWNSIPGNDSSHYFKWFAKTTEVASLDGTGNLTVSGSINAASYYAGSLFIANSTVSIATFANNANYLDGYDSSYFTNATNISTGTLSWNVLPQGTVNTSSSVTVSNTWTFYDIVVNGGIKAQNSFGNTNQVLASNGSGGIYWKQDVGAQYFIQSIANTDFGVMRLRDANNVNTDVVLVGNGTARVFSNSSYVVIDTQDQFVGTVTSVDGGAGLVGGPITDTGSLYVGAGAGISVNTDDVAVNAKDGLTANSSGLWVNTAYFSLLSSQTSGNNANYLQNKTWEAPGSIGNTTPNDGKFLDLQANTLYVKRYITANDYIGVGGTAINSTYFPAAANNAYLAFGKNENQLNVNSATFTGASNNASYLEGYTWEAPASIGETTANTGKFTYANVTSHIAFAGAAHMMGIGKITVSGTSPANIFEFSVATYTGGKMIIEVTDTHTNFRHISELLLSHDNTNVVATEYGVVQTANTVLATFDTDILSGNVRILATPISSNTTTFKVIQNLFLA